MANAELSRPSRGATQQVDDFYEAAHIYLAWLLHQEAHMRLHQRLCSLSLGEPFKHKNERRRQRNRAALSKDCTSELEPLRSLYTGHKIQGSPTSLLDLFHMRSGELKAVLSELGLSTKGDEFELRERLRSQIA